MKAWKSFNFEAGHSLPDNPRPHGHSYTATVFYATSSENPVSLKAIEKIEWQLKNAVDHQYLNDLMPSPTMESIAEFLHHSALAIIETQRIDVALDRVEVCRPTLAFGVVE